MLFTPLAASKPRTSAAPTEKHRRMLKPPHPGLDGDMPTAKHKAERSGVGVHVFAAQRRLRALGAKQIATIRKSRLPDFSAGDQHDNVRQHEAGLSRRLERFRARH